MALYVCLVEAAELVAIDGHLDGRAAAVSAIWGTSVGLALAHVFAFGLAATLLAGGALERDAKEAILLQILASMAVAAALSLPFVFLPVSTALQVTRYLAAAFVGATGYGVAQVEDRSGLASVVFGITMAGLATIVVVVKVLLSGH